MRAIVLSGAVLILGAALAACSGGVDGPGNEGGSAGEAGSGGDTGGSNTGAVGGTTSTTSDTGTTTSSTTTETDTSTGCEDGGGEPVSFANDVQPIFTASCGGATNGCHFKALPSAGLSLKPGQAWDELVNHSSVALKCKEKDFIIAGDANHSYLVDKLVETGQPAICGIRMPYQKPKLPDAQIATIVSWICQGAQNN